MGDTRILRIEDLDPPRTLPGSAERIAADLAWLGLRYEEGPHHDGGHGPYVQSARSRHYEAALETLRQQGLIYPCDCSRKELAEVGRAPHATEPVYPGLCRDKDPHRAFRRPPALRLRVPEGSVLGFVDALTGATHTEDVGRQCGDFVLQRGDGVFAYQLAVAVDDAEMGIDRVVRGRDLLSSTARQLLVQRLLGLRSPSYWLHLPLVVLPSGERLAKRLREVTFAGLRAQGLTAHDVLGVLAFGLGLRARAEPCTLESLQLDANDTHRRLSRHALEVPSAWLGAPGA